MRDVCHNHNGVFTTIIILGIHLFIFVLLTYASLREGERRGVFGGVYYAYELTARAFIIFVVCSIYLYVTLCILRNSASLRQLEVVDLVSVLHDRALDLGVVNPRNVVLHVPGDEVRWVVDEIWPHADVALLDKLDSISDSLRHLESVEHHWEPPPAHSAHCDLVFQVADLGLGGQDAHVVQLLQQQLLVLVAERVRGGQQRQLVCQTADVTADPVVLVVVLTVLDVVRAHDLGVTVALVLFPVVEIHLFQQFLLMILQFTCHSDGAVVI